LAAELSCLCKGGGVRVWLASLLAEFSFGWRIVPDGGIGCVALGTRLGPVGAASGEVARIGTAKDVM
jgi:hypothetical protein